MKKIFKWLFVILLTTTVCNPSSGLNNQDAIHGSAFPEFPGVEGILKVNEGFETWPPAGWTFASPDGGRGWERYSVLQDKLYNGGGYAAAAGYQTAGPNYSDQWMISPAIAVENGDKFSFWMFVVNSLYYKEKIEIRVSVSGNKTENFTTILETLNLTGGKEIPWTFKWYDLSAFAGKTIYIAIREYQSDRTQYPILLIDQFKAGKLPETDGALVEISVPRYLAPGPTEVTGKLLNLGTGVLNAFQVEYQVDKGQIEKKSYTGLSVLPGKEMGISFNPVLYEATTGYHDMKMWISGVSGSGSDTDMKNDTLTLTLQVSSESITNTPLFEEFTSSTCPPCSVYNTQYINPFLSLHSGELTLIKYQMNWPGAGDPYYNSDGYARRVFYRCNSVPTLYAGGKVTGLSSSEVLNAALTNETKRKTYLSLTSAHQLNKNTGQISVEINITPYVTSAEFTLYVAVVEKETTGNIRTNGETSFHHVMMKMLPDGKGTLLNLADKVPNRINLTASVTGTRIEEWSDLAVVAFVQNNETKELIQSVYSSELNTHAMAPSTEGDLIAEVYPSPFREKLHIRVFQPFPSTLGVEVISPDGRHLWSAGGKTKDSTVEFTWDGTTSSGQKVNPGWYILKISSEKQVTIRKVVFQP